MKLFDGFFNRFRKTIKPGTEQNLSAEVEVSDYELKQVIGALREISRSRRQRLVEYENMGEDSLISAAIEMIAEDSTQTDLVRDTTVWVESKDKEFEAEVNNWLKDIVQIDDIINPIAEQVVHKGEALLRTFVNDLSQDSQVKRVEEVGLNVTPSYFQPVADIASVIPLESKGKLPGLS